MNLYEHIPFDDDPRRGLKWGGRFAGIHDAINCYSPTEDIPDNATTNGWGGVWSIQELFKGTAALHLVPGNCEGGWGYNGEHTDLLGQLTEFAKTNVFTDAELIASPVFRKFDNALLHQTNSISIPRTELNKVMGDGIPAKSFAAGRNRIGNGVLDSVDYTEFMDHNEQWPRCKSVEGQAILQWLHSDLKKIAHFFVHKLFDRLTSSGGY